jgi:hypothetical protein
MTVRDALAAELAERAAAEGRMAAALVELEQHPGHVLLSTSTPTGRTAQRWAQAQEDLTALWQDFGTYQQVLGEARAVQARRAQPGDAELAELRRLLREPSVEVGRRVVARRLTGSVEQVDTITLDELAGRMAAAFDRVHDLLRTCHDLSGALLAGLTPVAARLRATRALARDIGLDTAGEQRVAALTARVDALDRTCAADPLALADEPPGDALAALATEVDAVAAEVAGLAAVRDSWHARVAQATTAVEHVEQLRREEEQVRQQASNRIGGATLAAPPDPVPVLRRRLAALGGPPGWAERAVALDELHAAVGAAEAELRSAHNLAAGLLERRAELRGRFEAYRAKANRLGLAERPELLELDGEIRRLLWTSPCDLPAATRVLVAYQRLLADAGNDAGRTA